MGKKEKEGKEKPLEKMTATELREIVKKEADVQGVHGLNKTELIAELKKARGIEDKAGSQAATMVRELKEKMKELKQKLENLHEDEKMATILRRKIIRLKKKTRRAA